jgi:hypothetical protein
MRKRPRELLVSATIAALLAPAAVLAAEPVGDEEFLEFLGSVDEVEGEEFQEYLAEVDVKQAAKAAKAKTRSAATQTSKSKVAQPKSEEP